MGNKIQDLKERSLDFLNDSLDFLNDRDVIDKLMKNDIINGHRPVQMYQDHHLQTIPKSNREEEEIKDRYTMVDIADIKAVIKCHTEDLRLMSTSRIKNPYRQIKILPCSIVYGTVKSKDELIFLDKNGFIMEKLNSDFVFKRFRDEIKSIKYTSKNILDNEFGIHIDSYITNVDTMLKLSLDDLEKNLGSVIVLK